MSVLQWEFTESSSHIVHITLACTSRRACQQQRTHVGKAVLVCRQLLADLLVTWLQLSAQPMSIGGQTIVISTNKILRVCLASCWTSTGHTVERHCLSPVA